MFSQYILPDVAGEVEIPDLVLLLIHRAGGSSGFKGVTRLEKLLFLLERESSLAGVVQLPTFDSYKYGPFSKEVYDALEFLKSIDLIEAEELSDSEDAAELEELAGADVASSYSPRTFRLTPRGKRVAARLVDTAKPSVLAGIDAVVSSYGRMPLQQLIEYVYRKYPAYTSQSLIRGRVLGQ